MTTYTELYSEAKSLRRQWFLATSTVGATMYNNIVVPVGATCGIISAVGAGGWRNNQNTPGGGGAFARKKLSDLVAGELFNIQVGSTRGSLDAGNSGGDSIATRLGSSTVVCKAARGTGIVFNGIADGVTIVDGGTPGLAADCIGDIKRSGKYGNSTGWEGGFSGGDLDLDYSLGFGGRGSKHGRYPAAGWGGGGIHRFVYDNDGHIKSYYPGAGRVCIDWFTKDPGF